MAVPRQKHTKSRRDKGRMHLFIKKPILALCPKCGKEVKPHTMCWNCGHYKGEQVINVMEKLDKKEKKRREKQISAKEKSGGEEGTLSMENLSKK